MLIQNFDEKYYSLTDLTKLTFSFFPILNKLTSLSSLNLLSLHVKLFKHCSGVLRLGDILFFINALKYPFMISTKSGNNPDLPPYACPLVSIQNICVSL